MPKYWLICLSVLITCTSCSIVYHPVMLVTSHGATNRISTRHLISRTDQVTDDGIGGLHLGMSDGEVAACCDRFYITEPGGVGTTYELWGWNGAIIIHNEYNGCQEIHLGRGFPWVIGRGWRGSTEKGIRIGSWIRTFKREYPEAKYSWTAMGWKIGHRTFQFDATGRLSAITIKR